MGRRGPLISTAILLASLVPLTVAERPAAAGGPGSSLAVSDETELRTALALFSIATTGPNTIVFEDDITVTGGTPAGYAGNEDLRIVGNGHILSGTETSPLLNVAAGSTRTAVVTIDTLDLIGADEGFNSDGAVTSAGHLRLTSFGGSVVRNNLDFVTTTAVIHAARVTIDDYSIVNNGATNTSAITTTTGPDDLFNVTIAGNEVEPVTHDPAVHSGGDLTMRHVTIDQNSHRGLEVDGNLTARNSVVDSPEADCTIGGTTTSQGGNIDGDGTCGFGHGTDQSAAGDPMLGGPRDNGSPPTVFPLQGSPVIDAANGCESNRDERDVVRPFGPACDSGAVEAVYPPHGFSDVPPWVEDAVRWITSGVNDPPIMTGFVDDTFRPDADITRGQVIRALYREAGSPDVDGLPPHEFSDVPAWVEDAVRWAAANDIVTGYPDLTFKPNRKITRAQVVRMKYRLADSPDVSGLPAHGLSDVPAWVENAVRWAVGHNLMTGYPDLTFRPNRNITRAEATRADYRLATTPAAWADPENAPDTLPFVGTVPPPVP